jgi:hypothetical protein
MRPMQNRLAKAKADRRFKAFLLVSIHTCSGCPPCSGTYGIPPPCAIFRSVFLGEYFLTDFYPIPPLSKSRKISNILLLKIVPSLTGGSKRLDGTCPDIHGGARYAA